MQLPLLYSVCGIAQATAAGRALRQALGYRASPPVDTAHLLLVQMETAREHLWRILIDWPALMDEPADARHAAPLQPLVQALREALFPVGEAFSLQAVVQVDTQFLQAQIDRLDEMLATLVFGRPASRWLEIHEVDGLADWVLRTDTVAARLLKQVCRAEWEELGAAASEHLPELPENSLDQRLSGDDASRFIAEPSWCGRVCETTALTRQHDDPLLGSCRLAYDNGLMTRLVARLVELARAPDVLRQLAAQLDRDATRHERGGLPGGVGIGQVEAARGRLVHRVVLDDRLVQRYQILAPTEWNFHPRGIVAMGLESLACKDEAELRRQAALLINAVDPCVGYELRVH